MNTTTPTTKTLLATAVAATLGLSTVAAQQAPSQTQQPTPDQQLGMQDDQMPDAQAQDAQAQGEQTQGEPMSEAEAQKMAEEFVSWASDGHLYAIQSADVVLSNSDDDFVKQVAEQLKADHEQGLDLLKQKAESAGIEVPGEIQYDVVEDTLQNLKENADSPELEAKYVFTAFGNAAESTLWYARGTTKLQDPALKEYANAVLPLIQSHGQAMQQVAGLIITGDTANASMQGGQSGQGGQGGMQQNGVQGDAQPAAGRMGEPDADQPGMNQPGADAPEQNGNDGTVGTDGN